jgi:triosephosphate isomerase
MVAANWKMHNTIVEAERFVDQLRPRIAEVESVDVVLCPAYLALRPTVVRARGSRVQVFAQNMHHAAQGPFTGEVSAPMLLEAGVDGVILGHSERRRLFGESDEMVQLKTAAAVEAGLVPIVCVSETEQECELGETERRLGEQLRAGLALVEDRRLGVVVVAYEPIWTLGTGRVAAPAHVELVGALLRGLVSERSREQGERIRLLYGGGVAPAIAADLLRLDGVDGLLVGEASLDPDSLAAIVDAVRRVHADGRGRPRRIALRGRP